MHQFTRIPESVVFMFRNARERGGGGERDGGRGVGAVGQNNVKQGGKSMREEVREREGGGGWTELVTL